MKFAILNGPNLNWLGKRETEVYGYRSWEKIWAELRLWAEEKKIDLHYFQSNHEGDLLDKLQEWDEKIDGIIFNPAAYTHTSIALRDCVAALTVPVVELHLTNISRREAFRAQSYIAEVSAASIGGFGPVGYLLGLEFLMFLVQCGQ